MGSPEIAPTRAYWTSEEVAKRLGVDLDTVYSLVANRGLPHIRVGRVYRFPIEAVLEWERLQLIRNDGQAPKPTVKRRVNRRASTSVAFVPQPYGGPLGKGASA